MKSIISLILVIIIVFSLSPLHSTPAAPDQPPKEPQNLHQISTPNKIEITNDDQDRWFGYALAASSNILAAGAPHMDHQQVVDKGIVYIAQITNTIGSPVGLTWIGSLTASDGKAGDQFGFSVAMSGDTIAVGANLADINGSPEQGAVYIFVRTGPGTWQQQAKLTGSFSGGHFGESVAIEGDVLVVGSPNLSLHGLENVGQFDVFERKNGQWGRITAQTFNQAGAIANMYFGKSVAIHNKNILIGAPGAKANGKEGVGMVWLANIENNIVKYPRTFTLPNNSSDVAAFGSAVAIHGDNIVIGAPNVSGAYFYKLSQPNAWQSRRFNPVYRHGAAVAINGSWAVVSAPKFTYGGSNPVEGYVDILSMGDWWHFYRARSSNLQNGMQTRDGIAYGHAVAVGERFYVVGAPFTNSIGATKEAGTIYLYSSITQTNLPFLTSDLNIPCSEECPQP